jgi:DNA polymerase III subunit delta'
MGSDHQRHAAAGLGVNALVIHPQGDYSEPPLPWLQEPLQAALHTQRGHALLVHAAPGLGALQFVLCLAQSWLCEQKTPAADVAESADTAPWACGRCGSCKLVQSRVHPDLLLLMPETLRRDHEWPLHGDKAEGEDSKRKPSKYIRVDDVRLMIDWAVKTSARGQGKVALIHPGEALNVQAANALLKTLEEPAPGTRLVITAADPSLLLPTVRSRCQHLRLPVPNRETAQSWLQAQGVKEPQVLLQAASGRPLDAWALAQGGLDAATWAKLPQALARGASAAFAGLAVPQAVDVLQKICVDAMASAAGAAPQFFPASAVFAPGQLAQRLPALSAWAEALGRVARHDNHPWNEGLLIESLVGQGARAFARAEVAT